jgi:hypothetical protein
MITQHRPRTFALPEVTFLPPDKYVAEYLRYLERYSRIHPAEDFIKSK